MIKFSLTKKRFGIASLHIKDSVALHQIHQHCFTPAWEKRTFDTFLTDHSIFGYKVFFINQSDQILGFCLCRLILDEAEIITIAVHPHYRQQGIATLLIDHTIRYLHDKRAIKLFLEVESTNLSALTLYQRFEFQKISERLAYYSSKNGRGDAIIMQKLLSK
ncbi:ribosomal protein S18-alanine N-acetyltransferase [Bartonella krasnovii]|uniref:Ribosomal protein S18-alanine N-acetyltransferase n=1 Tax=Bartonella krasnovii TaxID=2267275 RepID=A0A5B9CZM8_9HYPH|nr:ribosomal protein S18-alanine N-acetyltransferase [Bartonella krasnovii]QEE11560.1 ribosomal-protein-alanine N-acetyltransferase [Bartonella krasnovii]UNF29313.1 ribosomal protein S18-alanine N-acetyltransferase [Bartonella krasnovii]UNF35670.1 ribosomal protein S18-alanine N-acetyltransferase [Bartonella krasnovii]UNF37291.1 ribosomal protein S18-alanine N-acetyltransferase [Bartonella krasnovii]UNF38983.1 ribosomal protein S18-alanine N-acetyltransferase [Bartonella krasnovii]